MGYLAENAVCMPLTKTILEESDKFTCGNEDLDDFFQNDSIAYAEDLFGKTYCFQMKENVKELLCAFTVSNASIFTMLLPNARKKKVAKNVSYVKRDLIYPAVLIGRLGISTRYQQHHIGTELMNFIKSWFVDSSNKTGCRYLIVDAYNSDIPLAFYKKNGFDFIFSTEEQEKDYRKIVSDEPLRTRLMFFDLILIK